MLKFGNLPVFLAVLHAIIEAMLFLRFCQAAVLGKAILVCLFKPGKDNKQTDNTVLYMRF